MYKLCIALASVLMFAYVLARPAENTVGATGSSTTPASILSQVDVNNPDGSYNSRCVKSICVNFVNDCQKK